MGEIGFEYGSNPRGFFKSIVSCLIQVKLECCLVLDSWTLKRKQTIIVSWQYDNIVDSIHNIYVLVYVIKIYQVDKTKEITLPLSTYSHKLIQGIKDTKKMFNSLSKEIE